MSCIDRGPPVCVEFDHLDFISHTQESVFLFGMWLTENSLFSCYLCCYPVPVTLRTWGMWKERCWCNAAPGNDNDMVLDHYRLQFACWDV